MTNKSYRFILVPYKTPSSRGTCPGCSQPRNYTRFLDNVTGEVLPEHYGRCNRRIKCTYFTHPYELEADGMTYAQRIYREERGNAPQLPRPMLPRYVPPVLVNKVVCIPQDVYQQSMRRYEQNAFARLLQRHFGFSVAQNLLQRFHVGTSKLWPNACVFWLIDECGRIRSGQIVQFNERGNTVKDGEYRRTRWVHIALTKSLKNAGSVLPDWLVEYNNTSGSCSLLYGLSQLATAPAFYPIALVESPKAAIIGSIYWPQYIWMATLGLGNLNAERLAPLKGRRIILWPDVGGYDIWKLKATKLSEAGFTIEVSKLLEDLASDEMGLDLGDVFLRDAEDTGYPRDWDEKE